jgi:hypothetical protein
MEDFLYFLREYPFVAFLLIFFVLRKIFGGGEKAKKRKEEMAVTRAALREKNAAKMEQARATKKARKEGGLSGESILEQIQRQIEEATQQVENSRRGEISSSSESSLSRPEVRMSGPTDAETAAEQVRSTELFTESTKALSRGVQESKTDYDLEDHGFAYHSASGKRSDEKPEDVLWHLKKEAQKPGAYDFHSANQLSADVAYFKNQRKYVSGSRIEAPQVSAPEENKTHAPIAVNELFADTDALTRMFILQEVMGPPRGRRPGLNGGSQLRPR